MGKGKNAVEGIKAVGEVLDNVLTSQDEYNEGINDRYEDELQSDSWLTKNIRPMILLTLLLLWLCIVLFSLEVEENVITSLQAMTNTAFIFFFSSRGGEKIMKLATRNSIRQARKILKRRS